MDVQKNEKYSLEYLFYFHRPLRMTRNNTQEKKNISAKDSWRSTRQLRMQRRIEIGSTTNSHIRRGNKSDCHDLIVLAHAPSTRVPPNGTSLALEQACTVSYPRNIPSRHPRSVLSESRRDTTLGFIVYRFVSTHEEKPVYQTTLRGKLNYLKGGGGGWRVCTGRVFARDVSRSLHRGKIPDYFTERRAKFLSAFWSGYLISRLRSEFRDATRTYSSDLNSSRVCLEWRGGESSSFLLFSEFTRKIQIFSYFDPNWIESEKHRFGFEFWADDCSKDCWIKFGTRREI